MDREAWWATVRRVTKYRTRLNKQPSNHQSVSYKTVLASKINMSDTTRQTLQYSTYETES